VAIAGLGAMGSAAAYHLARRGLRVVGFDRYAPPHDLGSSHGDSRIIRHAYSEGAAYVEIVQRADVLWRELEQESGSSLLLRTGGVMIGSKDSQVVAGAVSSAEDHRLEYELLSAEELRRRYPVFRPDESMVAVADPDSGLLYPEACISAHLDLAQRHGARLLFDEPVLSWSASADGVAVVTPAGRYSADRLIVAAGAWIPRLMEEMDLPLAVERQVMFWYRPSANADSFRPEQCPIYIWADRGDDVFYGFPDLGNGVKIARMHRGEAAFPDSIRRTVDASDERPVREFIERYMPDAGGALLSSRVCMFTNTPDEHFLIDFHPDHDNVIIASPCSGHGFKFASVIGEVLADLATRGESPIDLTMFGLDRFL
jgi:sarcosine oxidase